MTIHFKYHTTRFGSDPFTSLNMLRKEFPNCHFIKGQHKDQSGIYVVDNVNNREYGEKRQLPNGDWFWEPKDIVGAIKELPSYKTDKEERIPVKLCNGIELEIYPASAIPRKVLFRSRQTDSNEIYNKSDEYGALAYEVYILSQGETEISLGDPRIFDLIEKCLQASYKLPIDVWDSISIISDGDIERLLSSSLGFSYEHLKKTIEESKEQ